MLSGALRKYKAFTADSGFTDAQAGIQSREVNKLILLLSKLLLHHDFDGAIDVMDVITKRALVVGEISMKCTREIMLHDNDSNTFCDLLKLHKQQLVLSSKFRVENLLELVFLLLQHENIDESFQTLQRSISNHSNPLCHGYTCLLAYLLWKRESSGEISTNDTKVLSYDAPLLTNVVEDNFDIPHTIGQEESDTTYFKTMAKQFEQMMQTIPDYAGVYFSFVFSYVQALLCVNNLEEALTIIMEFKSRHPGELSVYKLLIELLTMQDDTIALENTRRELVALDPSNLEVLQLAKFLITKGDNSYSEVFSLLVSFLDYPHNSHNFEAWSLLEHIQKLWPQYVETSQWRLRTKWWRKIYKERFT